MPEPIFVIVGFLGAGKTTLLKKLTKHYVENQYEPYIVLNDYENALMDSQQFYDILEKSSVSAMNGSCICCDGLPELRIKVNSIPKRDRGVTFIEANGTTDACSLLGFLGVGIDRSFAPPIQIAVVDARHWQTRGPNNELELNQVQSASLVIINYSNNVPPIRINEVKNKISEINPVARFMEWEDVGERVIEGVEPATPQKTTMIHEKSHWSSCSVDLVDPMPAKALYEVLDKLPEGIIRIKACTRLDQHDHYSYIEKIGSGEIFVRPYYGDLITGPKLLTIGPGSDPVVIKDIIDSCTYMQAKI